MKEVIGDKTYETKSTWREWEDFQVGLMELRAKAAEAGDAGKLSEATERLREMFDVARDYFDKHLTMDGEKPEGGIDAMESDVVAQLIQKATAEKLPFA